MLDLRELAQVATAFGVSDEQVRRDHLISHVLAALSDLGLPVIFFGGTALARTHLSDPEAGARLSEDIDPVFAAAPCIGRRSRRPASATAAAPVSR